MTMPQLRSTTPESLARGGRAARVAHAAKTPIQCGENWWDRILLEPLRIVDGLSDVSGVIGSGLEWREDAVARFAAR